MKTRFDTFPTAFGTFSVAIDEESHLIATAFGDLTALRHRCAEDTFVRDPQDIVPIRRELEEYFAGERQKFTIPIRPRGTPFQVSVWEKLKEIPWGETRSYGGLATLLGRPKAARAVGAANGANPLCVVVPCHRVIGHNNTLTGFAFGTALKARLLRHEGLKIND